MGVEKRDETRGGAEGRPEVRRALAELGWEVGEDGGSGPVVAGHGKYHLMVSFGEDGPLSVIISYVGGGGELLSRKWPGVARLPAPEKVVRALSRRR